MKTILVLCAYAIFYALIVPQFMFQYTALAIYHIRVWLYDTAHMEQGYKKSLTPQSAKRRKAKA